jgi:hypothetical protein
MALVAKGDGATPERLDEPAPADELVRAGSGLLTAA